MTDIRSDPAFGGMAPVSVGHNQAHLFAGTGMASVFWPAFIHWRDF